MASAVTVRVSKTIQEQQYEPLTIDMTITEPCAKGKYEERLGELTNLLSNEIYALLGIESEEEEIEETGGPLAGEEGGEGGEEAAGGEGEEVGSEGGEGAIAKNGEEGGEGGENFDDFFDEGPSGEGTGEDVPL